MLEKQSANMLSNPPPNFRKRINPTSTPDFKQLFTRSYPERDKLPHQHQFLPVSKPNPLGSGHLVTLVNTTASYHGHPLTTLPSSLVNYNQVLNCSSQLNLTHRLRILRLHQLRCILPRSMGFECKISYLNLVHLPPMSCVGRSETQKV